MLFNLYPPPPILVFGVTEIGSSTGRNLGPQQTNRLELDIEGLECGYAAVGLRQRIVVSIVVVAANSLQGDPPNGFNLQLERCLVELVNGAFDRLGTPFVMELGVPQLGFGWFDEVVFLGRLFRFIPIHNNCGG